MDLEERIMELSRYGYACGQILAILLLDTIGEENPALVRCMQGLNGGIGSSGDVCGCMAAGCCLISYFTGKPGDTEFDSPHHKGAMGEFTQWFTEEMEMEYRRRCIDQPRPERILLRQHRHQQRHGQAFRLFRDSPGRTRQPTR